jgi:UDP-2-acetamido-2-deoxy-ribo-hexuluronate aminotransferase
VEALVDPNVLIDVATKRTPFAQDSLQSLARLRSAQCRLFVYAGSVQTLRYQTSRELVRQRPELPNGAALRYANLLLEPFLQDFDWLAALAGEGRTIFAEDDPEDAQLIRALDRLGEDAILLTRDAGLLARCPRARSPQTILSEEAPSAVPAIDFIDLKTQQATLRPQIEENLHRVLHHGRYILGPEVKELEKRLAGFVGVKYCITVSSGTDALLIAMMALGIGPGDEVITVPYTWISTAEMIALLGARPVFVDILPDTWNMDPSLLEAAITPKTKAIMPVGIYGQPADMTAINAVAAKHGLPVIEDAAQSFGSTHHGRPSGGLSLIGCTSFFPSKPLGCYGDGGAVFTNDDELAQRMQQIHVHGQAKKHHHPILGINGRLDALQAAVLLAKLDRFEAEVAARQAVAEAYLAGLQNTSLTLPTVAPDNTSVWAQFTVLSPERGALEERLEEAGVPSVSYYAVPLHLQPVFATLGYSKGDFPVTERVAQTCLSLPMSPDLKGAGVERVLGAVVW